MPMETAKLSAADAHAALAYAGEVAACADSAEWDSALAGIGGVIGTDAVMVSACGGWGADVSLELGDPGIYSPELLGAVVRSGSEHPVLSRDLDRPIGGARRLSDFIAAHEWRRADLFNDFYRPLGMTRELSAQLSWGPIGYSRCLTLHRAGGDFSQRDRALLAMLAPHLRSARERIDAAALASRRLALLARDSRRGAEGTLVLDPDGGLLAASPQGRELLMDWFGGAAALPPELDSWRRLVRSGDSPPSFERRRGLRRLRISLVADDEEELILLCERTKPLPAPVLGEALGLTPRQAEVLAHLAAGETNDGIAHALGISRHTVVRHVEATYARLAVHTRAAATRAALDALD